MGFEQQNQADLFTKEHVDKSHCKSLRDVTVCPRESICEDKTPNKIIVDVHDDETIKASNTSTEENFDLIDEFDPEPIVLE